MYGITILAHGIFGPESLDELWSWWRFDPGVVIPLVLTAWLYGRGVGRLRRAAPSSVRGIHIAYFAGGWLALVFALVSPLHPWGNVLFSAHMTQHEVLMLIAAPLMVLSRPLVPFLSAFGRPAARGLASLSRTRPWQPIWRSISNPFAAWIIHAVVLWSWHVPALFDATLRSEWIHALQHLSFFLSALLFWWAVIHGRERAMGFGVAVLYMFTTALHTGLLGALLTLTHSVWYSSYVGRTAAWGLTPLEDQQIGGLIMWIPAGLVYVAAALALFAAWLRESGSRAEISAQPIDA